nr:hypothetical protein [Methylovulum psychrotolerans]
MLPKLVYGNDARTNSHELFIAKDQVQVTDFLPEGISDRLRIRVTFATEDDGEFVIPQTGGMMWLH